MHAELARRVGRGGDHAALIGPSADHHGLALERRIVQLFHRDEERVHIDVEIGAHKFSLTLVHYGSLAISMSSLRNYVRVTIVMAFVSLAALVLSYLALTDIYHGEADTSGEWNMVRVALIILTVFIAMTVFTLRRMLALLRT